ncbi:hypothetical protein B0H19DRAFT_1101444 [Mycena capillaripes]|nr:hypothetical protein B0H19DRAFT_1101444 [Mycena capillaripes]
MDHGHRRPRKRNRKSNKSNSESTLPSAHIFSLPFELIAEILVYTASPKDVLTLARCSKSLCNTLLREESGFIWRSVRSNCLPGPLPDPQAINLSESAFAALVFDGGNCTGCGKATPNMFSSWSLRLRFCSRPECRETWARNHTKRITNYDTLTRHIRKALLWIPLAESPACFSSRDNPLQTWPEANKIYITATMDAALAEYASANSDVVDKRHALDITRSPLKMSFYVTLYNWKHKRRELERQVKAQNEIFGRELAEKEGYVYLDLLNGSATYQNLYSRRTRNLEFITRLDYDVVAAKIEAEMISMQDKHVRRTAEATIRTNRAQVEQHYQRLASTSRSKVPAVPLPSLSEFRAMPILDLLQSPSASAPSTTMDGKSKKGGPGVTRELKKESLVNQLLNSELTWWRKDAEKALGATLGLSEWRTAKNNKLHPVARLTARWNCGKCGKVARSYKWDECLDYEGVCKHECRKDKKSSKGSLWKAEQFVKDDKAINAMTKLVKLCGIDAEDPGSFKALDAIGAQIRCLSCSAAIVMRPVNVPGHSHRHEEMNMSLLTHAEADALVVAPIEKGLAMKLMGYDDFKVKHAQKTWKYGCRHCEQHVVTIEEKAPEAVAPIAEQASEPEGADNEMVGEQIESTTEPVKNQKNQKKPPKRFEFNGLRSHLKEKHSIPLPHDEDFYHVFDAPETDTAQPR